MWRKRLAFAAACPAGMALFMSRRLRLAVQGAPQEPVERERRRTRAARRERDEARSRLDGAVAAIEDLRRGLPEMGPAAALARVELAAAPRAVRNRHRAA